MAPRQSSQPSAAPMQPETEPLQLGFEFLALSPLPRLAFTNATPHYHHSLLRATVLPFPPDLPPPPRRRARNQTPAAPFRTFGCQPLLPPRVCERNASTSPP